MFNIGFSCHQQTSPQVNRQLRLTTEQGMFTGAIDSDIHVII